ncbi:hypothetical protein IKG28_01360 [Candidatus Saccharibacteria bacterium]|nr:hypothetical protein [Candidatus Saccharibacteria bacterium]
MKNILLTLADTKLPDKVDGSTDLTGNITTIINAVIGILGLVCVIVMIIGGVNYMTSAGDAGKVKKGKDTILYGLIGLVICVLAFALVNWVISGVLNGVK